MKLAMNSFPSGRYIEEGSICQRLLNGIVVSIPMFCIGGHPEAGLIQASLSAE